METKETYYFATSTGDRRFLQFIYDRMKNKYNEDELIDYMHTLKAIVEGINGLVEKAEEYDRLRASSRIDPVVFRLKY